MPPSEWSPEETHGPQLWLTSFVDLAALLLSFMILAFSFYSLDVPSWTHATAGLRTAFGGSAWKAADPPPIPTRQTFEPSAGVDVGYLIHVFAQWPEAEAAKVPHMLAGERVRFRLASTSVSQRAQQVESITRLLGNITNRLVVHVRLGGDMLADWNNLESHWLAALTVGSEIAASFVDQGIDPTRLAVITSGEGPNATTATPVVNDSPTSGLRIELLVLGD
ncbi:MAG: hypothetical protein HC834_01415 [Rhodospirillales bacterium]|nr:hypothetical protein [Rhodospirillales bacterium]